MVGAQWRLVPVGGGAGFGEVWLPPELVEVSDDGRTLTAFFMGGDPGCHVVSEVRIERRDPLPPEVEVNYPMRLGVLGCTATLAFLAVRVPLDPPFVR